jgi:hypothetical protein
MIGTLVKEFLSENICNYKLGMSDFRTCCTPTRLLLAFINSGTSESAEIHE